MKPSRNSVHGIYSLEDELRLPGLADSIIRDMRASMVESIDKAVFVGDSGANENSADITGLTTAGIVESTITQANKVKGDELLKLFLGYVDGICAASMADVRAVTSVGSNVLWGGTVHAAAVVDEWGEPVLTVCDRFRVNELADAAGPGVSLYPRVSRRSDPAFDIRSLRRLVKDGPLAPAESARNLLVTSLSAAMVRNDDQGNTRLVNG